MASKSVEIDPFGKGRIGFTSFARALPRPSAPNTFCAKQSRRSSAPIFQALRQVADVNAGGQAIKGGIPVLLPSAFLDYFPLPQSTQIQ